MRIDDIYPYFSAEVPGCPDETMRLAVERVFREICTRAKVWTFWMDDIQLIDNEPTYDLEAPTNASLVDSTFEAWMGDRQLTAKSVREVAQLMPDYLTGRSNMPLFYNMPDNSQQITVYYTPLNATLPLRVKVIAIPKRGITTIPDDVTNNHLQLIEMGAKATLMLQNKQQWTDVKMGDYWHGQYKSALEAAAIDQAKSNVEYSDRVVPRAFGQY